MELEEYLGHVNEFAFEMNAKETIHEFYVPSLMGSPLAEKCVSFRMLALAAHEVSKFDGYTEMGFFHNPTAPDKYREVAWWAFCHDIIYAAERQLKISECDRYNISQPIFEGKPALFDTIRRRQTNGRLDYELIDENAVRQVSGEIYRFGENYAKLSPSLPPIIPKFGRENFAKSPRFLRLYPHLSYTEEPPMLLQEAAITPANPRWLQTLSLFQGERTFAHYEVHGEDSKHERDDYIDFHVHHVRRLEVTAQRSEPGYLTMMIEELSRADDGSGVMVGRCIHLDTFAPLGTPMADAKLNHLDLAINIYLDADRSRRLVNTFQRGKSQDANVRTHLYRIENIPFPAVFIFAELFLKSKCLIREWLTDLRMNK